MNFSVTLLMTEQCNLRCTYCYEKFQYKPSSRENLEKVYSFFKVLSNTYENIDVSFFGGEPMLAYANIVKLIENNINLSSNFCYSMTTNGIFLTSEKSKFLVGNGLKQIQITLDGSKDDHNNVRTNNNKKPTFDKIYQNAVAFKAIPGDFDFIFRINASPQNSFGLKKLFESLVKDFHDDPRFRVFLRPVGKWGGENDSKMKVLGKDELNKIKVQFDDTIPESMKWVAEHTACYAALPNHLLVYPDGRLGKCTVGIHDDINSIGFIDEEGKIEIDNKKFAFWTRGFASGDASQKGCPYWAS